MAAQCRRFASGSNDFSAASAAARSPLRGGDHGPKTLAEVVLRNELRDARRLRFRAGEIAEEDEGIRADVASGQLGVLACQRGGEFAARPPDRRR